MPQRESRAAVVLRHASSSSWCVMGSMLLGTLHTSLARTCSSVQVFVMLSSSRDTRGCQSEAPRPGWRGARVLVPLPGFGAAAPVVGAFLSSWPRAGIRPRGSRRGAWRGRFQQHTHGRRVRPYSRGRCSRRSRACSSPRRDRSTGHRGNEVGPGAGPHDLVAALAVEGQGPLFAGVEGGWVRYSSGVHSDLQVCVGRASGVLAHSPGPLLCSTRP